MMRWIPMIVLVAGCSQGPGPMKAEIDVAGSVVLPNGAKLEKGVVAFDPILASGAAREEMVKIQGGTFKLRMMPGKYRVAIDPADQRGATRPGVPEKFTKADTSGIEVEVKAGEELVVRLN